MQEQKLWSKKCPKCGHSALEHKHAKPNEEIVLVNPNLNNTRYCHHPVPAAGKDKDVMTFCMCEIKDSDYVRSGNEAMMRLAGQQQEEQVKRK